MTIIALGFDASTQGATWAHMWCTPNRREVLYVGKCKDERELAERLRNTPSGTVIGVETVERGLGNKSGDEKGARARAANLLKTNAVAHFIRATALAYGFHVEAMPSFTARRYIGLRGKTSDAVVKQALLACVANWPPGLGSNDHERDAAVIAIAAATRYALGPAVGQSRGWGT